MVNGKNSDLLSKRAAIGVIAHNGGPTPAEAVGEVVLDEPAETGQVVDVGTLGGRGHVFEAEMDGLLEAQAFVDDGNGRDAVEPVADDAFLGGRVFARRTFGAGAELCGV